MEHDSLTAVADLTKDIDRLVGPDPSTFADAESMEALLRQFLRLEAVITEAAAAFDASDEWAADGAKSAAAWLGRRWRMALGPTPRGGARRPGRTGRSTAPTWTGSAPCAGTRPKSSWKGTSRS